MTKKQAERWAFLNRQAEQLGLEAGHLDALLKIEKTLSRWGEAECNGDIVRDEKTGKPCRQYGRGGGPYLTVKCADRERGALKRLDTIMRRYPDLWAFHQTDPRGCALYIGMKRDLSPQELKELDSYYTRGVAMCY